MSAITLDNEIELMCSSSYQSDYYQRPILWETASLSESRETVSVSLLSYHNVAMLLLRCNVTVTPAQECTPNDVEVSMLIANKGSFIRSESETLAHCNRMY